MRIYISCLVEYRFPSLTQHVVPGGNRTFTSGAKCLQPSRKDSSLRRSEMFIDRNSRKDSSLRRSEIFIAPKLSERLYAPEERSAAKRHSKIRGYYKRIAPR